MPSLPPWDGVDVQLCTGIFMCALTISTNDTLSSVFGTSLPLHRQREHDAFVEPSGTFGIAILSHPCYLREHGGTVHEHGHMIIQWVIDICTHVRWGKRPTFSPHHFTIHKNWRGIFPNSSFVVAWATNSPMWLRHQSCENGVSSLQIHCHGVWFQWRCHSEKSAREEEMRRRVVCTDFVGYSDNYLF